MLGAAFFCGVGFTFFTLFACCCCCCCEAAAWRPLFGEPFGGELFESVFFEGVPFDGEPFWSVPFRGPLACFWRRPGTARAASLLARIASGW